MREHIRKMLETNETKTWGEMRKEMLPEERLEVYEPLLEAGKVQWWSDGMDKWYAYNMSQMVKAEDHVRLEPPAKKVAPRYKIVLVLRDSPTFEWEGGYWAVQYGDNTWMSVETVYAAGKTPVYHFRDGSQHPVFRHHGETATELSFLEDE